MNFEKLEETTGIDLDEVLHRANLSSELTNDFKRDAGRSLVAALIGEAKGISFKEPEKQIPPATAQEYRALMEAYFGDVCYPHLQSMAKSPPPDRPWETDPDAWKLRNTKDNSPEETDDARITLLTERATTAIREVLQGMGLRFPPKIGKG